MRVDWISGRSDQRERQTSGTLPGSGEQLERRPTGTPCQPVGEEDCLEGECAAGGGEPVTVLVSVRKGPMQLRREYLSLGQSSSSECPLRLFAAVEVLKRL